MSTPNLSDNPTLAEVTQSYLDNVIQNNYAESTYQSYRARMENHVLPAMGSTRVKDLKKLDIQNLMFSLKQQDPPLSANTIRLVRSILNCVLDFAVDMEIVARNVSDKITMPKQEKYQPRIYTQEEIDHLIKAAEGTLLHIPILLAATTGMRLSEILAAHWCDIDFMSNTVIVTKTSSKDSIFTPKTLRSYRRLQLPDNAITTLKEFWIAQKPHVKLTSTWMLVKAGSPMRDMLMRLRNLTEYDTVGYETLIVAKADGKPYNRSYISRSFSELLKANGLPATRFHDLRHAYATHAHYNGMPVKDLSANLGHRSAATTLDNYVHRPGNRKSISVYMGDDTLGVNRQKPWDMGIKSSDAPKYVTYDIHPLKPLQDQ